MTRTPSLPILMLAAVALLGLCACSRQSSSPQQSGQAATQSSEAAAPSSDNAQQAASGQPPTPSSPATPAQTPGGGSGPSLAHLAALPASAALPSSSQWKPGVNYDVISPAQPTTVPPGKVEVLEVFWLGCPHCYALEPYIRQWLKTKPSYVDFVRVPIMWGPVHRAHARLFYTLEALGRNDLVEKVFTYIHNLESQTGTESVLFSTDKQDTFRQQQAWAVQNGIDAAAFAKAYNSFYVNTQLEQADEIMNAYQVQGVPFIAVDGKFSTDVGKAGGENKLISLINFLAAWEHDHKQG